MSEANNNSLSLANASNGNGNDNDNDKIISDCINNSNKIDNESNTNGDNRKSDNNKKESSISNVTINKSEQSPAPPKNTAPPHSRPAVVPSAVAPSSKLPGNVRLLASKPPLAPPSAKRSLPMASASNSAPVVAGQKPTKRAKRQKPQELRSTVTTTTVTAATPVNVYDAVLGEAQDLLGAARQAQALGRLKMASAYQLLLHARLVGLGKRFDRAPAVDTNTPSPPSPPTPMQPQNPINDLAKFLPEHIELDSAMMEHLARAAMELQAQRTGRKIASDTHLQQSSPATGIAWTEAEQMQIKALMQLGKNDPADLAANFTTRSEAQIRSYLKQQQSRLKAAQGVEEEVDDGLESPRKKGRGRKPPTQAMNTVPNAKLDIMNLLHAKEL